MDVIGVGDVTIPSIVWRGSTFARISVMSTNADSEEGLCRGGIVLLGE